MINSKRLRSAGVASLLFLLIFAAAAKPDNDKLLQIVPAESLFCVRVNNLDNSLSQMDQFLTGMSPMPMFVSMAVRGQLAQLLGSPQLTGVDMSGSCAIFAVAAAGKQQGPAPSNVFIGALLPVTDYKQFIEGNSNLGPPDANGVSMNTSGRFGGMLIKQVGDYAFLGPGDGGRFVEVAKSISQSKTACLAGVLDADEINRAAKEPLWAYGNMQLVSKTFGDKIRSGIQEMKAVISSTGPKRIDVDDLTACYPADADHDGKLTIDEIDQQITELKTEMDVKQQNIQEKIKKLEQQKSELTDKDDDICNSIEEQIKKLKKTVDDDKRRTQAGIDRLERIKSRLADMGAGQKVEIKELVRTVEDVNEQPINPREQKLIANVMNMYATILETLLKETKSFSLTASPKPNVFNVDVSVSSLPGTDMADILVADTSAGQENKLIGYIEDGAVMNFAGRMNKPFWKLYTRSIDLMPAILGDEMSAEDAAKMKALVADAEKALGNFVAGSFSVDVEHKPPFVCKYVVEVRDEEKFDQLNKASVEMVNTGGIGKLYNCLGMEINYAVEHDVGSYKGVSIDSAKLVMKSTEPNSPQGQMINAMYGDGFDYRWAIVDGLCVCAMGGDIDSAIRELIDHVKAGGPGQMADEMKAALALIPDADEADLVGTYNFLRWFKVIGTMMPAPAPIPQMDIPTRSNVIFAAKTANGKMTCEIAVPKEHLMEMMGMFQMIQQQQMQQMQQMRQMQEAGATAPVN